MYNIIIVEDEEIFRKVLPNIIDWSTIGFQITGVFENGQKALDFLLNNPVDVILTDIRMPVLDGLDLAMEVKNRFPKIKVILLTAFNEFDYARKGINCGVYGYILKSEGEDEIIKYMEKLRAELDNERILYYKEIWCKRDLYFNSIVKKENMTPAQMQEIRKDTHLPEEYKLCTVMAIDLDEKKYMDYVYGTGFVKDLLNKIRDYLFTCIELKCLGYIVVSELTVYVLWTADRQDIFKEIPGFFSELTGEIQAKDKGIEPEITITCIIGDTGIGIEGLQLSYEKVTDMIKHRVYFIGGGIVDTAFLNENTGVLQEIDENKILGEILTLINKSIFSEMINYMDEIENIYKSNRLSDINTVNAFSIKIILAVIGDVGKLRAKLDDILLIKACTVIRILSLCDTIHHVFKQLKLFLLETMVLMNSDSMTQNTRIIEEAIKYIDMNYSQQIGLEDVSRHVNVHPVYLSRLFNKDTNKTFKTILTETRIEKAKKLLVNLDYKIYEISELVGYERPRYFSELFKIWTGLTPLEYREKYRS